MSGVVAFLHPLSYVYMIKFDEDHTKKAEGNIMVHACGKKYTTNIVGCESFKDYVSTICRLTIV
jgi:hypothetical protein